MIRSRSRIFIFIILGAFMALIFLSAPLTLFANAMSDVWYPPTCECSFGESAAPLTSKSTEVSYNSGEASLKTTYKFSASAPIEINCTLPVYCRQFELSTYEATLKLNGTVVTPSYGYSSKSTFGADYENYADILALRESVSELDRTIKVHQFIVTTTEDTSFSFSLQESDHIMYEFGRHSYSTDTRLFKVNITSSYPGSFLVFGNKPTLETTELCKVEYNELSMDEYITEMVSFLTEMTNGIDCTDIITHHVSEFLASSNMLSDDLFLDSVSRFTYGFLDYTLSLPVGESTIVVEQPMSVGLNSQFDPKVYVGKIYSPAQSAPLSFSVVTEQYVVDSTLELKNNAYGGDAAETITIAFCEVQKPDLVNGVAPVEWEPWRIALLCVAGVIGLAGIVVFLVFIVPWKKITKRK